MEQHIDQGISTDGYQSFFDFAAKKNRKKIKI